MNSLKLTRLTLYRRFDKIGSPVDFFNLQLRLAKLIINAENEIDLGGDKDEWGFHLDRLYAIGDALAWSVLSQFTIRQLGQYESVRTSLTGQAGDYLHTIGGYRNRAKQNIFIFADLTRCITIGDVIQVNGPEDIHVIEIKATVPKKPTAEKLLSGRTGRQFSKTFWLTKFLATGFETLYRGVKPTRTIEVSVEPAYHYALLEQLIADCLKTGTAFQLAEPGLYYIAQDVDKELATWVQAEIVAANFEYPILAGTGRLIEEERETAYHMPFLNLPLPLNLKIPVQEVDIQILGFLDVAYLKQIFFERGLVLTFKKDEFGIKWDGKNYSFNIRFINDILINFHTVATIADYLAEIFSLPFIKQTELSREEQRQTDMRPKDLQAFQAMLEKNYVTVQFSGKRMFSAHTMKGDEIDLKKLKKEPKKKQ
jgi:hypothetical protein